MNEITPIKKIDFKNLKIGESINIHVDRLASFKTIVSRYNRDKSTKISFKYSPAIDNYVMATRKQYTPRLIK